MRLSEAATSYLAHRILDAVKKSGGRIVQERLALAQAKKSLARHLERDLAANRRPMR